jgi:ABC-type transporter MlaC component
MATSEFIVSFLDYSGERSRAKMHGTLLTAGNYVAQMALMATLLAAIDTITVGTISSTVVETVTKLSEALPVDQSALREIKALVRFQKTGGGGNIYRVLIPTPDFTQAGYIVPGTDLFDMTDPDIAAFVAAFEAYVLTPLGEAIEVLNIREVGRDL